MTNSRAKGARGERELCQVLTGKGYEARRGQQYSGANGDPDIVTNIEGIHFEVKRVEKLNIDKAMEQSASDARQGEIPVVAHRKNGKHWLVTMSLDDWLRFVRIREAVKNELELMELEGGKEQMLKQWFVENILRSFLE